ncbi:MAG: hypothetical protein KBD36_01700 [Alphaproteobacteria bacterium]|nr:hypothetical protein [Alphaproteobacteria bacterium]
MKQLKENKHIAFRTDKLSAVFSSFLSLSIIKALHGPDTKREYIISSGELLILEYHPLKTGESNATICNNKLLYEFPSLWE